MSETAADAALLPDALRRAARDILPFRRWLVLIGLAFLAAAVAALAWRPLALTLALIGLTLGALAGLVTAVVQVERRIRRRERRALLQAMQEDASPVFLTDLQGRITAVNRVGRQHFEPAQGAVLATVLGGLFAAPQAVLERLSDRAVARGAAQEEVVHRNGHTRLSLHRVGRDNLLWRLDDLGSREGLRQPGETIALPMMTVSKSGTILSMNEALRRLLGGPETTLDRVITDLPLRPGEVHHVAAARGTVAALLIEMTRPGGGRELYLVPNPAKLEIAPGEWGVVERLPVPLLRLDRAGRVSMANQRARGLLAAEEPVGMHFSDLVEGLGRPVSDWLREGWNGRNLGRTETLRASRAEDRFLQVSLEQYRDEDGPALVAVLNDATELKSLETQFVQSQKMQAIGELAGGVAHDFNNLLTAISGHCDLLQLRHADKADPDFADLDQISQNANRAAALVGQLLAFSRKQTLRPELLDLGDAMGDLTHLLGRLVGERVRLELAIAPGVVPVRADKRQLEQVLMNLVVNARDAMEPQGGTIRITVENLSLERSFERDRARVPAGDYVTVRVTDEGGGIAPEHLEKVFEPFFTTKETGKGTGLGLSMVYGIVKQSGGFIFVDSIKGSGTTFSLYIPVFSDDLAALPGGSEGLRERSGQAWHASGNVGAASRPEAAQELGPEAPLSQTSPSADPPVAAGRAPAADPGADGGRSADVEDHAVPVATHVPQPEEGGIVLLVEDEAPVRAFAARALRLRGYTVLEAESAEAALEILEDDALNVDIFVTDVIMPGMDGPSWVAQALLRRPGVRVVFVSGYAEEAVSEHQARIPNSVFLPKPFSLAELTATVSQQLH